MSIRDHDPSNKIFTGSGDSEAEGRLYCLSHKVRLVGSNWASAHHFHTAASYTPRPITSGSALALMPYETYNHPRSIFCSLGIFFALLVSHHHFKIFEPQQAKYIYEK
jgi:hypothetical protein